MDEELKKLRLGLKEFIKTHTVYDMIPTANTLVVLSNRLSIKDLIDILYNECQYRALILDEDREEITHVFVRIDLINLLLSLKEENKSLLQDQSKIKTLLDKITIKKFYIIYKDYLDKDEQEIKSIDVS